MSDLASFLRQRVAEDLAKGRKPRLAERRRRVLEEIAAGRIMPCLARAISASILRSYADHPDFREEWLR